MTTLLGSDESRFPVDRSLDPAPATSSTGGSATSQAADLEHRAWTPKRSVSLAILAVMTAGPVLGSIVAVRFATSVLPRPDSTVPEVAWFALLLGLSGAVAIGLQRAAKLLAPLRALFMLTVVFPDRAPSRFRTALRAGTGRSLAQRASDDTSPDQAAAEELVTLLARLNRHDRLTRGHTERVRAYAVMLGEEIGLSRDDLDKLNWAALAHDVGKLEVPPDILCKAGQPTDAEWQVLRTHPGAAAHHVAPLRDWLGDWIDAATQHHERYDGTGYPHRLSGTDITLGARIVAIADAYDVMTAVRTYRKPLPPAQARAELLRNAGTQFDPHLVRSFLRISVSEMAWVLGPIGLLSNLPVLLQAPMAVASGPGLAAVAASAAVVLPTTIPPSPEPLPERPAAVELVEGNTTASTQAPPDRPVHVRRADPKADGPPSQDAPANAASQQPSTDAGRSAPVEETTTTTTIRKPAPPTTKRAAPERTEST